MCPPPPSSPASPPTPTRAPEAARTHSATGTCTHTHTHTHARTHTRTHTQHARAHTHICVSKYEFLNPADGAGTSASLAVGLYTSLAVGVYIIHRWRICWLRGCVCFFAYMVVARLPVGCGAAASALAASALSLTCMMRAATYSPDGTGLYVANQADGRVDKFIYAGTGHLQVDMLSRRRASAPRG